MSCGGSVSSTSIQIWIGSSQRIQILRFNGFTADPSDRVTVFAFSRDMLSPRAKIKLENIFVTTDNLSCPEDDVTYDITITDEFGVDTDYASNNKACNSQSDTSFVDKTNIDEFVLLLWGKALVK